MALIYLDKLRGPFLQEDGEPIEGTGRIGTINFEGASIDFNEATGIATVNVNGGGIGQSSIVASAIGTRTTDFASNTLLYTVPSGGAGLYRLTAAVSSMSTSYGVEFEHIISFVPSSSLQFPAIPLNLQLSAGFFESGVTHPASDQKTALLPDGYLVRYQTSSNTLPGSTLHYAFILEKLASFA